MCFMRCDFDFSRGITAFFCNALCCVLLMTLATLVGTFAIQTNFSCRVQFVKKDALHTPANKVKSVNTSESMGCSCCSCPSGRCVCKYWKNE